MDLGNLISVSSFESLAKIVVAVLTVLGALVGVFPRRKNRSLRDNLKLDVELSSMLPDGDIKEKLNAHISDMVDQLREESSYRRDPFGIALGLSFVLLGGGGTIWVISLEGWWLSLLIVLVPVFIMGFVGMIADSTKRKRVNKN